MSFSIIYSQSVGFISTFFMLTKITEKIQDKSEAEIRTNEKKAQKRLFPKSAANIHVISAKAHITC
jgi:hypothetical protein